MITTRRRRGGAALTTAIAGIALVLSGCGSDQPAAGSGATTTPAATTAASSSAGTSSDSPATSGTTSAATSDATSTSESAGSATRTVQAGNGSIEIPADPQRVVTIGNTTLPFIDMGGEPVGVTEESASDIGLIPEAQQAAYAAATNLGTSGDQVDMEQLAGLEPDLILVQLPDSEFEQIEKQLTSIAPTVFWGLDVEWKELADGLAEAGDVTDGLDEQKDAFATKLASIEETYPEIIADTSFVNVDRWSNSDPGTFAVSDIGCVEIAQGDIGMNFPQAAEGADPLAWASLSFEQIAELADYDVITYPVDAEGKPKEAFQAVVDSNTWKALPAVASGRALGLFCPGNNSYGPVLQYLDSLDAALASLPAQG
ncbi:ABC transporter substrate-binding protein [Nakamurella sp. YIM 132087]|uniref:ABC transporter substrate-binding protein n=1 Tax=Nakamurella alba TaxID=2665158 RepID=A0A7K1FEC4_9ACTN|nr:ABC transporter substrate-binding protein [Nakamurella alba]MTD12441.1 ABC transporter substrate-binding protein [Nakamurella alba]